MTWGESLLDPQRKLGPNMKKLIFKHMAIAAVPPGGGLQAAIESFKPEVMRENFRIGLAWAVGAVMAIKNAPDNTFGNDEEQIAGEILKRTAEREAAQALARKP